MAKNGATLKIGSNSYTLKSLGLWLTNNLPASPPEVWTYSVEVPGRQGLLDLTDAITGGEPVYKNRTIQMTLGGLHSVTEWASTYTNFLNLFHGRKVKLYLENDSSYYYEGRLTVTTGLDRTARVGSFDVEIDAYPFKIDASGGETL